MEAVFQPESRRTFPGEFRPFTGVFRQFLDEFRSFPYEVRTFVCEFSQDTAGKSSDISWWNPIIS